MATELSISTQHDTDAHRGVLRARLGPRVRPVPHRRAAVDRRSRHRRRRHAAPGAAGQPPLRPAHAARRAVVPADRHPTGTTGRTRPGCGARTRSSRSTRRSPAGSCKLGVPALYALVGISWLAVARRHRRRPPARRAPPAGRRTAPWATWFLALAPGAVTMVMGYSDSLYLAGAVWALVLVEDRRWWAAGLLGAVATASRPNGWIAVAAVVVTVLVARAGWRALVAVVAPSAVFFVGWCWYLWSVTGDPLVFYDAKSAWDEVTHRGARQRPVLRRPLGGPVPPAVRPRPRRARG